MTPAPDPTERTSEQQSELLSSANPDVSVIIALHRWNERSARSVIQCVELQKRSSLEVIVVSDQPISGTPPGVRWLVTGATGDTSPALKRDLGASVARGTYLAYIDDDAYPDALWIDRALEAMESLGVDGVGGPGVTPDGSNWRERLGGAIYCSILGSGPFRLRFTPLGKPRIIDELPAYNFTVKRECMENIGGWNSSFYGGEDTAVCTQLRLSGYRLGYSPDVVVYHYRREVFRPHLRQIGNVGRHRGYFVRKRDASSLRVVYFAPSFAVACLFIACGLAIFAAVTHPLVTLTSVSALWIALSATAVGEAGMMAIAFPIALITHHLWYGVNFVRGMMSKSLDTERDTTAMQPKVSGR
jgi:GT2 family glycosyltransferase